MTANVPVIPIGPPGIYGGQYQRAVPSIAVDESGNYVGPGSGSGSAPAGTSVATNVPAATSATSLLAANATRKRYLLTNDSSAIAYVLEGAGTVSLTNYSFQLTAGQPYATTDWSGPVSAIWSAPTGAMRVTEQTP